jgi:hypothetical protein
MPQDWLDEQLKVFEEVCARNRREITGHERPRTKVGKEKGKASKISHFSLEWS